MDAGSVLEGFIAPKSIAVVGGSDDQKKPGGKIVANLLAKSYQGELFIINPKAEQVQGLAAFRSIADLPFPPDLAYTAIPAGLTAGALTELGDLGVKRVIVLSAGFGEVDEKGRLEKKRLAALANHYGITLLGPNCLGLMTPVHAGKFAGLLPDMKIGGIDFVSGSGATVDILSEQAVRRGLVFHALMTVGNSAQMGVTDMLALLDQAHGPQSSEHIMLYLEKIGQPDVFLHHARNLTQKGCVLMTIKSGVTEAGRRAAASHTGAMAADDVAVTALFQKAGAIRLHSKLEMVDVATALTLARGHYDGRRICVVSDAGGPGVMIADELNRQGIDVPPLKESTKAILAELLPLGAGVGNPVDLLPTRTPEHIYQTLEIICREEIENIDYILLQLGDPGFESNWPTYQTVIRAMDTLPIPIFPSFATAVSSAETLTRFHAAGKCHFEDEVSMARAVGQMANRPRVYALSPDPSDYDGVRAASLLEGITGVVPGDVIGRVLEAAGIPQPAQQMVTDHQDLSTLAERIPDPWVMKVVGPLHKTDVGGVITGVTHETASEAFQRLMAIDGAQGVLVQETAAGPEVIMGLVKKGEYGHLAVFGLGGMLVEAIGDVQFSMAPLAPEEAKGMIHSIRALPVLKGYRGRPGMDLDYLANLLVKVSLLSRDVPGIKEMDINPLKGTDGNLKAVDVRIIME